MGENVTARRGCTVDALITDAALPTGAALRCRWRPAARARRHLVELARSSITLAASGALR
jgi:hypothetical protein